MKKIKRMSDAETQIMNLIWKAGRPVTTAEIMTIGFSECCYLKVPDGCHC